MFSSFQFKITAVSLIVTNIFLMIMAISLDWKTYDQVMVFWCENLVVGFYTAFKIPFCRPVDADKLDHYPVPRRYIKIVIIPFFLLHFLMFCALHLVLIHMLFYHEVESYAEAHKAFSFPEINRTALFIAFIALMVNHGISYFVNFISKKEYLKFKMDEMMFIPYKRLILGHFVVLVFGLILSVLWPDSATLVALFFTAKIWIDIKRHQAEHDKNPDSIYSWF